MIRITLSFHNVSPCCKALLFRILDWMIHNRGSIFNRKIIELSKDDYLELCFSGSVCHLDRSRRRSGEIC